MQNQTYQPKHNVTIVNKLSGVTVRGDIINEDQIEGKSFYVMKVPPRTVPLRYYKDAWSIVKGKK